MFYAFLFPAPTVVRCNVATLFADKFECMANMSTIRHFSQLCLFQMTLTTE